MYSKNDLKEDISNIWLIYTRSYEYYYILKKISVYKKTDYTDTRFLMFVIYTSWYILIIELSKAYQNGNRNQHYNVYSLLNKLLNNYRNLDFKSLITLKEIKKLHSEFNSEKITNICERLTTLRDKFYAHSDRQQSINEVNVKLIEIGYLLAQLKNLISVLKLKVFDTEVEFRTDIFIDIEKILMKIEKSNQSYHNEIQRKFDEERKKL